MWIFYFLQTITHKNYFYTMHLFHASSQENLLPSQGEAYYYHEFFTGDQSAHFWEHQIPKTKKVLGGRINLTFRKLLY